MKTIIKRILLILLIITIADMLLCSLSDSPFDRIERVDLLISVPKKEGGFSYCLNESVEFKVTVLLPHLVKKIEVDFGEKGETKEREITTNKRDKKEIDFRFKYKETGLKNVLFTIYFNDLDEIKEIFYSIDIGRLPKIQNEGNLVYSGEVKPGKNLILFIEHEEFCETFYEWYKGEILITGEYNPLLIYKPLKESDEGEYYCIVRTKWGEQKSKVFTLNFEDNRAPPKVSVHSRDIRATQGNIGKSIIFSKSKGIGYRLSARTVYSGAIEKCSTDFGIARPLGVQSFYFDGLIDENRSYLIKRY